MKALAFIKNGYKKLLVFIKNVFMNAHLKKFKNKNCIFINFISLIYLCLINFISLIKIKRWKGITK